MNIIIKDDQGLYQALMMDGYSQEHINEAKQAIRRQFRETASKVFQDVMGKPLPDTIVVNMSQSNYDEIKKKSAATLASFNVERSHIGYLYFTIHEISVKNILNHGDDTLFVSTILHEMFHAADLLVLKNELQLFEILRKRIYDNYLKYSNYDKPLALMDTLAMFNHYRDEGIAVLGESLLSKKPIKNTQNPIKRFKKNFLKTMKNSSESADGDRTKTHSTEIRNAAYKDAPFILLFVLHKLGCIDQSLATKTMQSIGGKNFLLTEDEVQTIMRSAIDLTLGNYIKGLMLLGDNVAPILPFLYFCCKLQFELEINTVLQLNEQSNAIQYNIEMQNAAAFTKLIQQQNSAETYKATIDQIMGSCIPEEELDEMYEKFINTPIANPSYPEQEKRVSAIYTIFKNENDDDRKLIAHWALTYFFDDQDVIHDDLLGIGFIDDLVVLDYALNLLK